MQKINGKRCQIAETFVGHSSGSCAALAVAGGCRKEKY